MFIKTYLYLLKLSPFKCNKKAFTLVELLVALVVVSVGFMALLPLMWNSMSINQTTNLGVKAREIAVQKVEDLMSYNRVMLEDEPYRFDKNTEFTSNIEYFTENGIMTDAEDSKAVFQRTYNIRLVAGVTTEPVPIIITSIVRFTYKGQVRSRTFSTVWSF